MKFVTIKVKVPAHKTSDVKRFVDQISRRPKKLTDKQKTNRIDKKVIDNAMRLRKELNKAIDVISREYDRIEDLMSEDREPHDEKWISNAEARLDKVLGQLGEFVQ